MWHGNCLATRKANPIALNEILRFKDFLLFVLLGEDLCSEIDVSRELFPAYESIVCEC